MAKEGKGYNQSMFTNKDGYLTGGKKIKVPSQNVHLDPRSKTSIRGRNYIAQGDTNTARGSGAAKKQKVTWY
jgi:hypothetical protein